MAKKGIWFLVLVFMQFKGFSQVNSKSHQLNIKRVSKGIVLDGQVDDEIWSQLEQGGEFMQNFPVDNKKATSQTKFMIGFDDDFLYVGGICYENSNKKKHIVESLKRDFGFRNNEGIHLYIDTFNDLTNGFTFGLTPMGVQREGLLTNGQDVSTDWDNKWFSAVQNFDDRWEFEMKIPLKTIRYNESNAEWNLIILRNDLKNNERSSWAPVPQGYRPSSLAFSGKLNFVDPLPAAGTNISLIPFAAGSLDKDHEEGSKVNNDGSVGFDAKIALNSALNLDLTFNPDFSQVEVDRQVVNLSRFEIFFPERRQFFLENNDLFAQNGFGSARPFFSRRIGIASKYDEESDETKVGTVPIIAGGRLSGKIGDDWRLGVLNMHTLKTEEFGLPAQNFSMGVIQKKVFSRSNVSFLVVNKQSLGMDLSDTVSFDLNDNLIGEKVVGGDTVEYFKSYNRVFGVDYNLLGADGKWEGNVFYHQSNSPANNDNAFASGLFLRYRVRKFNIGYFGNAIGENYNAEVGFVRRKDVISNGIFTDYYMYPKESKTVNNHGPNANFFYTTNLKGEKTDMNYQLGYQVQFLNTMEIEIGTEHRYELLRNDFYIDDDNPLPEGSDYEWDTYSLSINTDRRARATAEMDVTAGGFYNGTRVNVSGGLQFRFRPFGSITVAADYNKLEFPEPFSDEEIWLIGPRLDLTFTDKLFLTTFVQYNEQGDNLNVNARFQYRFKPASDLFIVYTDNYFPNNLKIKNRALVIKLSYWLNL